MLLNNSVAYILHAFYAGRAPELLSYSTWLDIQVNMSCLYSVQETVSVVEDG